MSTLPTIGIAVIAKNEADRIGRLLDGAAFADEVVVVDSGSTDDTVRICRQAGARVVTHPWQGYAAQKQFALEQLSTDWILNLDADESVSPELAAEIRASVSQAADDVCGFTMPRLSWYLGRWIRHGGWYPDRKLRLVRRHAGTWSADALHERLDVTGRVNPLTLPLHHHVYRGIADQINTINRFSDVHVAAHGGRPGSTVLIGLAHLAGKFLECYVWKGGMLDGLPGLIIAVNSAWYVFLKHAKAWERHLDENRRSRR